MEGERGTAPATSDAAGDQQLSEEEEEQGPPQEDDFFAIDLSDTGDVANVTDVADKDIAGPESPDEEASPPPDLSGATTTSASSTVASGPSSLLRTILAVHQLVRLAGHRFY